MKKSIYFVILLSLIFYSQLSAQVYSFQKTYPSFGSSYVTGYKINIDQDGNIIIGGYHFSELILVKVDSFGNTIWHKEYDVDHYTNLRSFPTDMTNSGKIIAITTKQVDNEHLRQPYFLKFNSQGDTIFTKVLELNKKKIIGCAIYYSLPNRYYVLGGFKGSERNKFFDSLRVYSLDSTANIIWEKDLSIDSNSESAYFFDEMSDGSLLIGSKNKLQKLSANGEILWSKLFGYNIYSVKSTFDNKIIIGGDKILIKLDSDGHEVFSRFLDKKVKFINSSDSTGWLILQRSYNSIDFFTKMDSLGNIIWNRSLDGSAYYFTKVNNSGFLLSGSKNGIFWLLKTEPRGKYREIRLLSPNGGEKFYTFTKGNISWYSHNIDSVSLDYSIDGGLSWNNFENNYVGRTNYEWSVPGVVSDNCLIRIYDSNFPQYIDTSDNPFSIADSVSLKLQIPNGGEEFLNFRKNIIQWISFGIESVDLFFSTNNGSDWNQIVSNFSGVERTFDWTPTTSPSDKCLVKIIDSNKPNLVDISDSAFSIIASKEYEFINTNRIKMWISNNGDGSHDPNTNGSGFYWPTTDTLVPTAIFEDGLVYGGIVDGQLYVNGSTYRHGWQSGIILQNGKPDNNLGIKYRIYKIKRDWELLEPGLERDKYEYNYYNWPGDIGAPFEDIDGDGEYTQGIDKPKFIGDEVLFYVANDLNQAITEYVYGSPPIGLEFHVTVWGYNSDDFLKDVVFKKYLIINKGDKTVEDMYFSYWADDDLGNANDDYVGCDSTLNFGYSYNADNYDEGFYGANPPAVGHMLIQGPIVKASLEDSAKFKGKWIKGYRNLNMTSFAPNFKNMGLTSDPPLGLYEGSVETYNFMQSLRNNGEPFVNPYSGKPSEYPLSGNPYLKDGWYEGEGFPNGPKAGDRRYYINSGPITLAPGDTQIVVYAVFIARGNNNLESIAVLKKTAEKIQSYYNHSIFTDIDKELKKKLPTKFELYQNYPNPFNPTTTIKYSIPPVETQNIASVLLKIYDILGREVAILVNKKQKPGSYKVEFDAQSAEGGLPSGVYFYRLKVYPVRGGSGSFIQTKKMLLIK